MMTEREQKIQEIADRLVDSQVGLDAASVIVKHGGSVVEVWAKSRKVHKPSRGPKAEADKFMRREWRETGESVVSELNRTGYRGYEVTSIGVDHVICWGSRRTSP